MAIWYLKEEQAHNCTFVLGISKKISGLTNGDETHTYI
jgi:hypothetical protein